MRKTAALFLVAVLFALFLYPVGVYADTYDAYFTEPTDYPLYEVLSDSIHIKLAWVYQLSTNPAYICYVDANYPLNTHFYISGSSAQSMYRTDQQPTQSVCNTYELVSGTLVSSTDFNGVRINDTVGNLSSPNYFKWVNNTVGNGYYPVDSNFHIDNQGSTVVSVNWAEHIAQQVYYHSVLPMPVADDYNRFVVLTGENEGHLLWLNYHFQFLYGVQSQTSATFEEYDIKQSQYYAPTVRYSDDGFSFRLQMDPILFLYLSNLNFSGSVCCNYTLTDYNLITGEFISMTSGNLEDLQPDIQYNLFSGYIDFEAVGIDLFGLNYEDTRSEGHLHRAAVLYSTDPDFERWKQSVLTWLENIYNVISATESAEDVTIDNNIEAASELTEVIDALQPTDENGSKINTADVVSERFSDAGAYIGDMRDGGTAINQLIDTFFFSSPFFYVPVIVALALGLLITILGKNKSD